MKPVMQKGQLTTWKDDRGFGFLQPSDGGQEIFLHITALKKLNRRPQVGDVIYYQLSVDKDGKVGACNAFIKETLSKPTKRSLPSVAEQRVTSKPTASSALVLETILLSLLPGLGVIHFAFSIANPIPLILYPVMSWLTFILYAEDKSRAKQGRWRVSENTLHLCEMMGGWIGAFIAQRRLRHKSSKVSYQIVFWSIVVVHLGFWIAWLFFNGTIIRLLLNH